MVAQDRLVKRPRLLDAGETPILLIEAPGGSGKSVLLSQLTTKGEASARVDLGPSDHTTALLVSVLIESLRRDGLTDLASALVGVDEQGAAGELVAALEGWHRRLRVSIDDAHHLDGEAADWLADLADRWPSNHRLVIAGRRWTGSTRPTGAGVTHLGAADLALDASETRELMAEGFSVDLTTTDVDAILRSTDGWAAAVALCGPVLENDDRPDRVRHLVAGGAELSELVEAQMARLDPSIAEVLRKLAHVPLLSSDLAAVVGAPTLVELVTDAGLPLRQIRPGWWELPGPVVEHLTGTIGLDVATAVLVAEHYLSCSEPAAAFEVLLRADAYDEAAELFGGLDSPQLERLGRARGLAIAAAIPPVDLNRHPRSHVNVARLFHEADLGPQRLEALERAEAHVGADAVLGREVKVEIGFRLLWSSAYDEATRLADEVLAGAGGDEKLVRARALQIKGRALALQDRLAEAEPLLDAAADLLQQVGAYDAVAAQQTFRMWEIDYQSLRLQDAVRRGTAALEAAPPHSPTYARSLTMRAEPMALTGQFDQAEADLLEARALAEAVHERGIAHLAGAILIWHAGSRGDLDRFRRRLREFDVDAVRRTRFAARQLWFTMVADAANMLGEDHTAREFMDRAAELDGLNAANTDYRHIIAALSEARSGDPAQALVMLDEAEVLPHMVELEGYRIELLRAFAYHRLGDRRAGIHAARAFDRAARAGQPALPLIREPVVARQLMALAAEAGSATANSLRSDDVPHQIRVLDGFAVLQGGLDVDVPAGKPATLLKMLACSDGRLRVDAAIDWLWPDADGPTGAKGLRNVLSRLRSGVGDIVQRDENLLVLDADVTVDLHEFVRQAQRAVDARSLSLDTAAGLARAALARYGKGLLPDDLFADWAEGSRSLTERLHLALVDILIDAAVVRGGADEAVGWFEAAVTAAPYDEIRYLRAARELGRLGRQGVALDYRRRCFTMLKSLELDPSPEWAELPLRMD